MSRHEWSLYWLDRNSKFHRHDAVEAARHVEELLGEIDSDPTAIFRGEGSGAIQRIL